MNPDAPNINQEEKNKSKRELFYNKLREYQLFEVQRVPYIDNINDYISQSKDKQAKNEKLLYFKNLKIIEKYKTISEYLAWTIMLLYTVIYGYTSANYGLLYLTNPDENSPDFKKPVFSSEEIADDPWII